MEIYISVGHEKHITFLWVARVGEGTGLEGVVELIVALDSEDF